jgi:hypothetical protein
MKHEHDEIDYDGMGNHGRFPPTRPENNSRTSDLLVIVCCLCVPIVYLLIR